MRCSDFGSLEVRGERTKRMSVVVGKDLDASIEDLRTKLGERREAAQDREANLKPGSFRKHGPKHAPHNVYGYSRISSLLSPSITGCQPSKLAVLSCCAAIQSLRLEIGERIIMP